MWHSWVSWCLESWRLDPYASHLRHIGYVGLSQSPMARSPDLLAGPKLTEQPRWLVFLEPQFELRVLGHQPRGLCKSGVAGRGRGGGVRELFSSCQNGLKHQLLLCLIQTKSLDLKKAPTVTQLSSQLTQNAFGFCLRLF
jgi:hypothetical protein